MTDTEKVQAALDRINYILAYKFITLPVKDELEAVKDNLESILGVS
mgnify:FL=1